MQEKKELNDIQGRAIGMNDLLNIELNNDNLKMSDRALGRDIDDDGY